MSVEPYGDEFFEGRSRTVLLSANEVVPILNDYLGPKSVLDVGCGKAEWGSIWGLFITDVWGVDIAAPVGPGLIKHDLRCPLSLDRDFDLVLCLETGEHLPEESADTLVNTCVKHSQTIVFSAAVPGQAGKGHINCQPHEYWHEKFSDRGYEMSDPFRPALQGNPMVSPWYANNIFLYERL